MVVHVVMFNSRETSFQQLVKADKPILVEQSSPGLFLECVDCAVAPEILLDSYLRCSNWMCGETRQISLNDLPEKVRKWIGECVSFLDCKFVLTGQGDQSDFYAVIAQSGPNADYQVACHQAGYASCQRFSRESLMAMVQSCIRDDLIEATSSLDLSRTFLSALRQAESPLATALTLANLDGRDYGDLNNRQLAFLGWAVLGLMELGQYNGEVMETAPPAWYKDMSAMSLALIDRSAQILSDASKSSVVLVIEELWSDIKLFMKDEDIVSWTKGVLDHMGFAILKAAVTTWNTADLFQKVVLPNLEEIPRQLIQLYLALRLSGIEREEISIERDETGNSHTVKLEVVG